MRRLRRALALTQRPHPTSLTDARIEKTVIPKTPTLTDAEVVTLLDNAARGIFSWAGSCRHDEEAKTYRVVARGDELEPGEKPTDKTVTYDDLRQVVVKLTEAGTLPARQMHEIEEADLNFDARVADLIVQQALFGRHVFH